MNTTAFQVHSVTYAMRGKTLLQQRGIHAHIHRTTTTAADNGCGYSIVVAGKSDTAEHILRTNGIPIRRIVRGDPV